MRRGAAGSMACGCAAPILAHVNLLLAVYGGAALATAARLKWDPSTYVALRELLPAEYAALAGGAAAAGALLLLAAHAGAAALALPVRPARARLLRAYAGAMAALLAGEAALGAWLALRLRAWAARAADDLREALELRQALRPLLRHLARWHPLPRHVEELVQEAEQDAPRNLYVCAAALALLALLQALAAALALAAARAPRAPRPPRPAHGARAVGGPGAGAGGGEKVPLRTAYRSGRLVVL